MAYESVGLFPVVVRLTLLPLSDLFDHDKNGTIEFKELLVGIGIISNATDEDRAAFFFNLFDTSVS